MIYLIIFKTAIDTKAYDGQQIKKNTRQDLVKDLGPLIVLHGRKTDNEQLLKKDWCTYRMSKQEQH